MIMLIVFHIVEILGIIYELLTIKFKNGGGKIKTLFKINLCYGIAVYIFI